MDIKIARSTSGKLVNSIGMPILLHGTVIA
jgi:hypothetical protein